MRRRHATTCRVKRVSKPVWKRSVSSCAAGDAASPSVAAVADDEGDYYVVNLPKPLGVSFRRGNDGRAYVADVNPAKGNVDPNFELGDRIVEV